VTGDGLAAGSGAAPEEMMVEPAAYPMLVPFPDTTGTAGFAEGFEVLGFEALGFPLAVDFVDLFLAVVFAGGDTSATSASDGIIPLGFLVSHVCGSLRRTFRSMSLEFLLLTESGKSFQNALALTRYARYGPRRRVRGGNAYYKADHQWNNTP
jgi:hypothetical protein